MIFKLAEAAEKNWRRLDGHNQLPKIILGVRVTDRIEVVKTESSSRCRPDPFRHQRSVIAPSAYRRCPSYRHNILDTAPNASIHSVSFDLLLLIRSSHLSKCVTTHGTPSQLEHPIKPIIEKVRKIVSTYQGASAVGQPGSTTMQRFLQADPHAASPAMCQSERIGPLSLPQQQHQIAAIPDQ